MVGDPDPKVRADIVHTPRDGSPRSRARDVVHALETMLHDPDARRRRRVRKRPAHDRAGGKLNIL